MSITKAKQMQLKKSAAPIPIAEMTTSVADHRKNQMMFMPSETLILYERLGEILAEVKLIREAMKK
jgi:hypothetical protein